MNIVWKRPDGGVSITIATSEQIEAQTLALQYANLVPQESVIRDNADKLSVRLTEIKDIPGTQKQLDDIAEEISIANAQLRKIEYYHAVKISHGLTIEEHAKLLQARGDIPAGYELMATKIPDEIFITIDKENFRNAWTFTDKLEVNMVKAVEITKDRLRKEREPLLEKADIDYLRAMESQSDTKAIVAEKQRLRDLPTLADQARTLDELKALKP